MSQVKQIKQANDVVEVIGQRLDLKRAGSSYKALCPFHSESSPSFFINEQLQRYKCFGCQASGDVIEFLQNYEGMSFLEALKHLADRAGIKLKEYRRSKDDQVRETLLEILNLAKQYYHFLLTKHEQGQAARAYLKQRGTTQKSTELFQLGYALPAWDGLYRYLVDKKGYQAEDVLKTGLIIKSRKGHRYYDRFRDRIIFPLKNHRGQVVGFSGRALNQDEKTPKYINTPETSLYHKAQMLYGFHELYQEIRKQNELIIVEGEFDVISSTQAHVYHIAAIKGSALTKEHARLIKRAAEKVILCLDADPAGVKATQRAIKIINDEQLELRVIDLSRLEADFALKDVDDLAQNQPKLWRETVKDSVSVYDFLLEVSLRQHDATQARGKRQIIDDLAPTFAQISHQVEKDFYIQKLAEKINVRPEIVRQDIVRFGQAQNSPVKKRTDSGSKTKQFSRRERLERYLLFILFQDKQRFLATRAEKLLELDPKLVGAKQILQALVEVLEQHQNANFNFKKFVENLAEDLKARLFDWYQDPEFIKLKEETSLSNEWQKTLTKLKKLAVQAKISQVNQEIEELDTIKNKTKQQETRLAELLQKIVKLQVQLK